LTDDNSYLTESDFDLLSQQSSMNQLAVSVSGVTDADALIVG
jgi:hypothetical protein